MDITRITYLHGQYLQNRLTKSELEEWKALLANESAHDEIKQLMDANFQRLILTDVEPLAADRSEVLMNKIWSVKKPGKVTRPFPRWAVAAAVATVIFGAGLFVYNQMDKSEVTVDMVQVNDAEPGKQGATLTLASGKTIRLSEIGNGKLAEEAGVVITKSDDGELIYEIQDQGESNKINTLSTANGETYRLRLPDGSTVWLNAASSLTYAASLNERGKRRVKLSGEGYFSVAKNKALPFVVETDGQEVEVLGTEFNVNNYADEQKVTTTLVEGSVKVNAAFGEKLIRPGEQVINNGEKLLVAQADLENITDWKDGDFSFSGVEFETAMRKVARWYKVDVIYETKVSENVVSGGLFSRKQKLSTILKGIENTGLASFRLEGNKLYVMKFKE